MAENVQNSSSNEQRVAGAFRSAMFWNIANMGFSQVLTVAVFIFLTFQLDPVVFGIFALGVVVIDYFTFQAQSSAVDAVLQSQDFSKAALSSAFHAALLVIIIATILCAFSGGLMATAMQEDELTYVLPVLALTLLPLPFQVPSSALLLRDHDFKGTALRGILASCMGGVAAIAVALSSYGEWALVAQRGVAISTASIFLMLRARWFPSLHIKASLAFRFLRDTGRIFFAQAVAASVMRVLDVIVGLSFGAAAVGLLRISSRLVRALYGTVAAPIGSLWVIFLSKKDQNDEDRAFLLIRLTKMSAFVCLPVFAGFALTAYDLVEIALDKDYAGAAPLITVISIGGLFIPIAYFRNHAFTALKKLNLLLAHSVIDLIVVLGAALILSNYSLVATLWAIPVMFLVRALLTLPELIKTVNARWSDMLAAMAPGYLACLAMAAAVLALAPYIAHFTPLVRLGLKASLGAVIYFTYLFVFHRDWIKVAVSMFLRQDEASASNISDPVTEIAVTGSQKPKAQSAEL